MKKQIIMFFAAAMAATAAFAEPEVTDVVAKQRYPWNGLVDIDCTVSGIEGANNGYKFVVVAVDKDSGKEYTASHLSIEKGGTGVSGWEVSANGDYELLWDARADLGQIVCERMTVRVSLEAGVSKGKVQLWAGGPYWADRNVGASSPEDYGLYFWWGDTTGHRPSSDGTFSFSFEVSNCPTSTKDTATLQSEGWIVSQNGTNVLAPSHDAAQVQWGGGWRMPTYQELHDLCYNKCDWTWTSQNGVNGYVVRGRGDYAANSIFLPAAGYGYGTSLSYSGSNGRYWSSEPRSDYSRSWGLYFGSSGRYADYGSRYNGFSVRPVQGFNK